MYPGVAAARRSGFCFVNNNIIYFSDKLHSLENQIYYGVLIEIPVRQEILMRQPLHLTVSCVFHLPSFEFEIKNDFGIYWNLAWYFPWL